MKSTSGVCDLLTSDGSKPATEVNSASSRIEDFVYTNGTKLDGRYTFVYQLSHLEEGHDYRFCLDLHVNTTSYYFGDVGYKYYLTPVIDADTTIILDLSTPGYNVNTGEWQFTCPNCTDSNTIGVFAPDCDICCSEFLTL